MKRTAVVFGIVMLLAAVASQGQAPDPLNGTWKLNIAKSKWSPAELTPKSGMTRLEVTQDTIKGIVDGVDAQGRTTHVDYTVKLDGKDYPWKATIDGKPDPGQDAVTCQKIDSHTYIFTNKLKGQVLTTQRTVIAPDGKTRTNTVTGKNAQGQVLKVITVYEKQ
jgi:hypothetical protein